MAAAIGALIRRGIEDIEHRDGIRLRKMPNGPAILAFVAELDAIAHRAAEVKRQDE